MGGTQHQDWVWLSLSTARAHGESEGASVVSVNPGLSEGKALSAQSRRPVGIVPATQPCSLLLFASR